MLEKVKYVLKGIGYSLLAIMGLGVIGLSEAFLKLSNFINYLMEKINRNN
jgi:hypothetical protein